MSKYANDKANFFFQFLGFGYSTSCRTIATSTRQYHPLISSVQIHLCIVNSFAQTDATHLEF